MSHMDASEDTDLDEQLAQAAEARGYLLPHHALMAVAFPDMLEDYDRLYRSVAQTPRHLSTHEREAIWLAILATREEALGTHHVAQFLDTGGQPEEVDALLAIAGLAQGSAVFEFAEDRWTPHVPRAEFERSAYRALQRVRGSLAEPLALMASVASLACAGKHTSLRWQLKEAYRSNVDEYQLAEALSLVMLPGSVPNFARAADVWLELIRSGEVSASKPFQAWAETTGQGGFDEASGVIPPT